MARAIDLALRSSSAAVALLVLGCGGGVPLLHGAHVLAPGSTLTGVGFSSTFTAGEARGAVDAARASDPSTAQRDVLLAKHSAVMRALAPAVAPFIGMRIGIPGDNEVGLSYTGRILRLDARHAFESGDWACSLGAGGRFTWSAADPNTQSTVDAEPQRASSYGFDVPLLVGWRSDAGIVSLWGGARGGLERIIDVGSGTTPSNLLDLSHWHAGGVMGLAVGFRHIHAAIELETSYHGIKGTLGTSAVEVNGVTLTPAGGLLFTF